MLHYPLSPHSGMSHRWQHGCIQGTGSTAAAAYVQEPSWVLQIASSPGIIFGKKGH